MEPRARCYLLREVLASVLYSTRKGSTERGKIWSQIAERLNETSSCKFSVNLVLLFLFFQKPKYLGFYLP